jgi:hypothetical protein
LRERERGRHKIIDAVRETESSASMTGRAVNSVVREHVYLAVGGACVAFGSKVTCGEVVAGGHQGGTTSPFVPLIEFLLGPLTF